MPNGVVWSNEEDELLRQLVAEHGPKRWAQIASRFPSKCGKQCRRRWVNHLTADTRKGSWTEAEDARLVAGHAKHGNKWTLIAQLVGGRTDNAVKNRWAALCKKQANKRSRSDTSADDADSQHLPGHKDQPAMRDGVTSRRRVTAGVNRQYEAYECVSDSSTGSPAVQRPGPQQGLAAGQQQQQQAQGQLAPSGYRSSYLPSSQPAGPQQVAELPYMSDPAARHNMQYMAAAPGHALAPEMQVAPTPLAVKEEPLSSSPYWSRGPQGGGLMHPQQHMLGQMHQDGSSRGYHQQQMQDNYMRAMGGAGDVVEANGLSLMQRAPGSPCATLPPEGWSQVSSSNRGHVAQQQHMQQQSVATAGWPQYAATYHSSSSNVAAAAVPQQQQHGRSGAAAAASMVPATGGMYNLEALPPGGLPMASSATGLTGQRNTAGSSAAGRSNMAAGAGGSWPPVALRPPALTTHMPPPVAPPTSSFALYAQQAPGAANGDVDAQEGCSGWGAGSQAAAGQGPAPGAATLPSSSSLARLLNSPSWRPSEVNQLLELLADEGAALVATTPASARRHGGGGAGLGDKGLHC